MSPRAVLRLAAQTLALMVGVAGACLAVLVEQALDGVDEGGDPQARLFLAPAAQLEHEAAARPPAPAHSPGLELCRRGYSSVDSLAETEPESLWWAREQARARCRASLGDDAPACDPARLPPLEAAVCRAEERLGEGRARRATVVFDPEQGRLRWLIDGRPLP